MALFPPLRVRDLDPPEDGVPPPAWARVVEKLGDEIIARPTTAPSCKGQIRVGVVRDETTWARIKEVLLEWVQESEPWITSLDGPWEADQIEGSWESDPDAWKG